MKEGEARREPKIFWCFIDSDRQDLYHEAKLSASQSVALSPVTIEVTLQRDSKGEIIEVTQRPIGDPPKAEYSYMMSSGAYVVRNSREVVAEAISWWSGEIARIEKIAATTSL